MAAAPSLSTKRRADIFFSLYLDDIVKAKLGRKPKRIIPEFPIRKRGSNLSKKMDYLAFLEDPPLLVFIELKTDPASMGLPQLRYLLDARNDQERKSTALLDGLKRIAPASKATKKYHNLIGELIKAGLVDRIALKSFELSSSFPDKLEARILYIHPCIARPKFLQGIDRREVIDVPFEEVVSILKRNKYDDHISTRFLKSLHSWSLDAAKNAHCIKDSGKKA